MSIFFDKDNKAHWFYGPDEIGYRLTAATLTKSLENEVDFDPRASIFVFHNGKEIDRLFLEKMKNEATLQNYSGIWGAIRGLLGKKEANIGASLFVLKRGKIYFDNARIEQLTAKNYLEVNCDCVISAEIADPEKFVTNALREQNHPELAHSGYVQAQKNFDEESIKIRKDAIAKLRTERTELQKQRTWWKPLAGEQQALRQRIADIAEEIKQLEKEIANIRENAKNSYLKEINAKAQEGFDYFIFTANDLYKSFIQNLVSGILQRLAAEHDADELVRMNFCDEVQNIIATNANVIRRLSDLGIALTIEDVRFVSDDEKEVIQQIRTNARESRERKWKLEGRVETVSYKRDEQKVVVEEHQIELESKTEKNAFDLASTQLDKDNEFAKGNSEFSHKQRLNPVQEGIAKADADHSVAIESINAEKESRSAAITDLLTRNKFKTEKELEWFKKELERQGLLKNEEFAKLQDELDLIARDRKWNKEDTETRHDWDNEELEARHKSFMTALASALGLEEAQKAKALNDFKRAEALVNLQHTTDYEKLDTEREYWIKRYTDAYNDERKRVELEQTKQQDDYDRGKKIQDASVDLDIKKAEWTFENTKIETQINQDEQVANNAFARQQTAADNEQRRQMERLNALNAHELAKEEAERLSKKDDLLASLEGKRSDNEKDVAIAQANAQAEVAKANSADKEARFMADGLKAGMELAMDKMETTMGLFLNRDTQEKVAARAHEEEMARINAQAQGEQAAWKHEETMAGIQSGEAVAKARAEEKDNTIAHLSNQTKEVNDKVCDKCNRYFPSDFDSCPYCKTTLRKVTR